MENFSNRNAQQPAAAPAPNAAFPVHGGGAKKKLSPRKNDVWVRAGVVAALVSVVILIAGVVTLCLSTSNNGGDNELKYVYTNKLQAVFLNTGQVYFGNIQTVNSNYLVLSDIYYLQTSSSSTSSTSSSASSVSLVKLGCELHKPYDQMVINRSQITFWENLQSSGQVATAVAKYQTTHPNGDTNCADQSSSSSTSAGTSTQNANNGSTDGTGNSDTNP